MQSFLNKYFYPREDYQNEFGGPAPDTMISETEVKIGIELPEDYKSFLRFANGFEGFVNESYVRLVPVEKIYQLTQDYCMNFPWATYIGTNGNVEMFVIDTRSKPYVFGFLPYLADEEDFIPLGTTFEKFMDRIFNNTEFDKNF